MTLRRPARFVVVTATMFCAIVLLGFSPTTTVAKSRAERPKRPIKMIKADTPRVQYPPQSYGMPITYYSVRGDLQTRLTLNNKGGHVLTPRVTLYARDGRRYAFDNVVIASGAFAELDMRQLAAIAGEGFEVGSVRVSYTGLPTELGGMLRMTNVASGIEFSEPLMYPTAHASNRLEGVWWLPDESAVARLAVTNTTGSEVDVQVHFSAATGGRPRRTQSLHLGPWQLQVLDFTPSEEYRLGRAGGISISYTGAAGGVKARGMIANYSVGYSNVVEFSDPAVVQSSTYHGAGLRLAAVGPDALEPVVIARNVSDQTIEVVGRIQVTSEGEALSSIDLPTTALAPGETTLINARAAFRQASSSPWYKCRFSAGV